VTYILILLEKDLFDHDEGIQWLTDARNILQELDDDGKLHDIDVYLQGGATTAYDTMNRVYTKILPRFIPVTAIIAISFLCIIYKSVMTMVRCIISITYTFIFTFGCTVLVYQYGCFHCLSIRSLSNDIHEICFWAPLFSFGVIFGLISLNYNIDMMSNVLYYRLGGYFHASSIILGVQSSYTIATIFELMILIVFGSFLFITTNMTLNQLSFMIIIATLFNMCIVRPFLDPILLCLIKDYNYWWPIELPLEEKDLIGDEEVDGSSDEFLPINDELDSLLMSD